MNHVTLAQTSLPDIPPIKFLEVAAAAGFDGVGLRLHRSPIMAFHPVVGDAPLIREMKRILAASRLTVLDILSFYLLPKMDFDEIRRSLELGAEFGATYAMAIGDDPDWSRMCDNFGRFCDAAASVGLVPSIEFAILRHVATLHDALRLIKDSGRSDAVLALDPINLIRGGATVADLKAVERRLLPYAQIADGIMGPGEPGLEAARRNGQNERRLLGEGVLPLREIMDALPPAVPLSVELPPPSGERSDAGAWAQRVAASVRGFLETYHRDTRR